MLGTQVAARSRTIFNEEGTSRLFGQLICQCSGIGIYCATSGRANH
jgi:hypothetical protein